MTTDLQDGSVDLEQFRLAEGPETVYYIPDFVTEVEEKYLLKNVNEAPLPRWTQLSNRRLQNWGGLPLPKGMIAEAIPSLLQKYTDRIGKLPNIFPEGKSPNHILVNEYLKGQGIMPHVDGPLFYPTITTISLGSHTVINFYRPLDSESSAGAQEGSTTEDDITSNGFSSQWDKRLEFSLLLQPRSLLILKDKAYDYFLHGIEEKPQDVILTNIINLKQCGDQVHCDDVLERSTRVSLTIRHVPKTTKPMLKLFGKR